MYIYGQQSEGFGQITPVVAGPDYFKWVQRSLNLSLKKCLAVDGLDG